MRRWPECFSLLMESSLKIGERLCREGLLARRIKGALLISCFGPSLFSRTNATGIIKFYKVEQNWR
jgi:hypothetical protein